MNKNDTGKDVEEPLENEATVEEAPCAEDTAADAGVHMEDVPAEARRSAGGAAAEAVPHANGAVAEAGPGAGRATATAETHAGSAPDDAVRSVVMGAAGDSNAPAGPPAQRTSIPRARLLMAAVGACICVALIGVSAWSLVTGGASAPHDGLVELVAGSGSSSTDEADPDDDASARSAGAEGGSSRDKAGAADKSDSNGDPSSSEDSSSGSGTSDTSDRGASNNENGSSGSAGGGSSNSTGGSNGNAGGNSGGGSNGGSGGSSNGGAGGNTGSGSGGSSSNGGGSAGGAPGSGQDQPKRVSVTISADGSLGGGGVSGPVTLTFEEGATVYDALASAGWSAQASWGAFGAYVTSINGVAADAQTGWTYTVNGSMPSTACSSYKLSDGDVVVWTFVKVK